MGTSRLFPELIFLCVTGHSPHHPRESHCWVALKAASANTCWHSSECSSAAPAQLILNKTCLQMAEPEWQEPTTRDSQTCVLYHHSAALSLEVIAIDQRGYSKYIYVLPPPCPSGTGLDTCCMDRLGFIVSLSLEWVPSTIHLLSHSHLENKSLKSEGLAPAFPFCPKHCLVGLAMVPHRMQAGATGLVELVKLLCTVPHAWLVVEAFRELRCGLVWALGESDLCLWQEFSGGGEDRETRGGAGFGCICNVLFLIFLNQSQGNYAEQKKAIPKGYALYYSIPIISLMWQNYRSRAD